MDWIVELITNHETALTLWLGALCTLGIFSLLYKENPYYRLCEHVFIGLSMGQGVFLTWDNVLYPKWWQPMVEKGQWWWAFGVIGGLMFYFIFSKKNVWIQRLIFGMILGLGAGAAFLAFANMYFPMIEGSFKPIIPNVWSLRAADPGVGISTAINNFIFITVLITVMSYFFFSIDHKAKSIKVSAGLGRWFLMFAFGAMFGSTVMARMALFIGRFDFMYSDWAPIVPLWFWIVLALVLAGIVIYFWMKPKPPKKLQEAVEPAPEPVGPEAVTESTEI